MTASTYARVADGRTKLQLVLDQAEKDLVALQAEREGTTMSEVIRQAIRYYCDVDLQLVTVERQ
jgi:hypothetical protein